MFRLPSRLEPRRTWLGPTWFHRYQSTDRGLLEHVFEILRIRSSVKDRLENLKIIDRNSQRLLLLVNQLLDFRKVEQGALVVNPVQTKVYDLLKSVCDRFSPLIEQHGMEFVLDCPDKSFCANVDQEFITKMLSNLLSNALKLIDSFPEIERTITDIEWL